MDVCETEEIQRPPLVPSEKNNAVSRKPRTREITSRYKAAITTPTVPRRCPSPNLNRTDPTPGPSISKRAQSAERRRPSTPSSPSRPSTPPSPLRHSKPSSPSRPSTPPSPSRHSKPSSPSRPSTPPSPSRHSRPSSPSRPSTPLHDSSTDMQISSRRLMGGRTPEGLWPSTRSPYVSFQSDSLSLLANKKERPVPHPSLDHSLKPPSNVAHRQAESLAVQHKVTPERKRTPLKGKNTSDQSENSKPVENSHARVIDQHRWPSRTGGKMSANALNRSMDLAEKPIKVGSLPIPGRGVSPIRRVPAFDGVSGGLQKSVSEVARRISFDGSGRVEYESSSIDDTSLKLSGPPKHVSSSVGVSSTSLERVSLVTPQSKFLSSPLPGLRPPSPGKATPVSSFSRAMLSPSRTRPSTPFSSASSVSSRSSSSTSVLSFAADVRKGKKGANQLEDTHQLRLLYNRYLQWRFVNTRTDTALSIQKVTAENIFYNVWRTTSELRDSVTIKRINLQQLRQELKLNLILKEQVCHPTEITYQTSRNPPNSSLAKENQAAPNNGIENEWRTSRQTPRSRSFCLYLPSRHE
ncbi:AUGMIN subunit 8-like isoform X2 [Tasmannia lanceolata]|uniref:AUGMIN subunit 8-like isoform X2 n=1 Tax=Tasmannia lanceolata TaxID=3420 RepID=UPI004062A8EA